MLYFQIIIGGITRLTGSGLSITKWEIVTGTIPPVNEAQWEEEFEKYKLTPQYQKVFRDMTLGTSIFDGGSFKFIYFWEYFHRLWARSMGLVFIIPFLFFWRSGLLPRSLIKNLMIVVLLASFAAIFGWIMVASGLVDRPWVNAYKLSIHLGIGISVFLYLLWSTCRYMFGRALVKEYPLGRLPLFLFILLSVQILFGGIKSGMKAALFYPTWPDMRGSYFPDILWQADQWRWSSFVHYDDGPFVFALIHVLHRNMAYVIILISLFYLYRLFRLRKIDVFQRKSYFPYLIILLIQVVIGIVTLLESNVGFVPVFWGVLHQGVGVLLIACFVVHYYFIRTRFIS